jgi:carboxyl-terminal processing protease
VTFMEDEKVYVKLTRHEWPDERVRKRKQRWIIRVVILAVLFSFTSGWFFGSSTQSIQRIDLDESKYARLDAIIGQLSNTWYYGRDIENLEAWLLQNAIDGMFDLNGDPYTSYMTAQEVLDFEQSIDMGFVGIGVQFYVIDGINIVERVFKNSPAERFGVMPGDIIYRVEGIEVEGMPTSDIAAIVMGEAGTIVTIDFIRANEIITKEIERGEVRNSAYGEIINNNIGLIEINQFGSTTHLEIKEYLDEMANQNIENLIIDMRDNGGGYLESLLNIASFFLEKDTVVIQQKYKDDRIEIGRVTRDNYYDNFKNIIVLVNGNTASASEVLTAALKEQAGVIVVGETTFGKGSVQITRPFSDGSALKLTTAQWLTPQGNLIQDVGITPDVEVKQHPAFYQQVGMMEEDLFISFDEVSEYVLYVQKALDFIGYDVDRMDGYMSRTTLQSINAFNAANDLEVTDTLSPTSYQVIRTEVLRKWYTNRRAVDLQLQVAIGLFND